VLKPERALEMARRIQMHQVTLRRRHTASGLSAISDQRSAISDQRSAA
jgi:hypothetical protein